MRPLNILKAKWIFKTILRRLSLASPTATQSELFMRFYFTFIHAKSEIVNYRTSGRKRGITFGPEQAVLWTAAKHNVGNMRLAKVRNSNCLKIGLVRGVVCELGVIRRQFWDYNLENNFTR